MRAVKLEAVVHLDNMLPSCTARVTAGHLLEQTDSRGVSRELEASERVISLTFFRSSISSRAVSV